MHFWGNNNISKIGEEIGFFTGFLFFASALYLILRLLNKIPDIGYLYIPICVIIIYLIRLIIKSIKE